MSHTLWCQECGMNPIRRLVGEKWLCESCTPAEHLEKLKPVPEVGAVRSGWAWTDSTLTVSQPVVSFVNDRAEKAERDLAAARRQNDALQERVAEAEKDRDCLVSRVTGLLAGAETSGRLDAARQARIAALEKQLAASGFAEVRTDRPVDSGWFGWTTAILHGPTDQAFTIRSGSTRTYELPPPASDPYWTANPPDICADCGKAGKHGDPVSPWDHLPGVPTLCVDCGKARAHPDPSLATRLAWWTAAIGSMAGAAGAVAYACGVWA